ncbi:tyrosine-type recombinase/integrase [Alysiella crassa]|nr:integrase arm-type DNA-binding domain-containing protein [Alysiella crassa]UOP08180.1 integrase arm-type DNA-binding domain-containing protein [Alysiella crassa]
MMLNNRQIQTAKPKDKPYKLSDGGGLYLLVTPAGGKLWRLKYRFDGKEMLLAIGKYPDIALIEARAAADTARNQLANEINPAAAKQQAKAERKAALLNTFEHLARQWHKENLHRWKANHAARILSDMEKDVFPYIGQKPLDDVSVADVKLLIVRIGERGALVTAEKVRQWIGAVFHYAAMLELTDRNPATPLRGFLEKKTTRPMPALPREELTEFYRRLMLVEIEEKNRIAILLNMLLFIRSTELRGGKWAEIDFQAACWTVPAERMKMKIAHIVPLSDWAVALLRELYQLTGHTPYLFPSRIKADGFISDGTLINIMNNMGYKGIATPHGFRSLASSILNEQGFNPDSIERQLAHMESNRIRAAYNRAEYLDERKTFMQWYSDYLRRHYDEALASLQAA